MNNKLTESGVTLSLKEMGIVEKDRLKWLKVLALSFAILVMFIIGLALWLKFSGIGHNIVYELSSKQCINSLPSPVLNTTTHAILTPIQ